MEDQNNLLAVLGILAVINGIGLIIYPFHFWRVNSYDSDPVTKFRDLMVVSNPRRRTFFVIILPLVAILQTWMTSSKKKKLKKEHNSSVDHKNKEMISRGFRLISFKEQDVLLAKGELEYALAKSKVIQVWLNEDSGEIQTYLDNAIWDLMIPEEDHGNAFYKYEKCPNCLGKTLYEDGRTFLRTEGDYNIYQNIDRCDACGHQIKEEKRVYIAPDDDDDDFGSDFGSTSSRRKKKNTPKSKRSSSRKRSRSRKRSSWKKGKSGGGGSTGGW